MVRFWFKADCTSNFHGILTFKENAYEKMVVVVGNTGRAFCLPEQ
jgi:hypothetical protein